MFCEALREPCGYGDIYDGDRTDYMEMAAALLVIIVRMCTLCTCAELIAAGVRERESISIVATRLSSIWFELGWAI